NQIVDEWPTARAGHREYMMRQFRTQIGFFYFLGPVVGTGLSISITSRGMPGCVYSVRLVDKTSLSPFFVASIRSQSSRAIPEIGSCPSASHAFMSARETSLESSAWTTSTSSPSHWTRYWCFVEGIQQLA